MSAHTPGPWKFVPREVLEDGSVYPGHIIGGVTEMQICLLESPAVAELKQNDQVWSRMPAGPFEEPNANLITAAPKLLEALEWLVDILPDPELDNDALQRVWTKKARAAIAEATGDKP